ncbi:MAG: hypothetical protein KDI61_04910 [Alphaproteobacteria bacterium]|nr:hypothetical protein [Alphaproteobacteria bacterium]
MTVILKHFHPVEHQTLAGNNRRSANQRVSRRRRGPIPHDRSLQGNKKKKQDKKNGAGCPITGQHVTQGRTLLNNPFRYKSIIASGLNSLGNILIHRGNGNLRRFFRNFLLGKHSVILRNLCIIRLGYFTAFICKINILIRDKNAFFPALAF